MRSVKTFRHGDNRTTVFYSPITGEYIVKLYVNGKPCPGANYFTDDKSDAIGTARLMVKEEPK